MGKSSCRFNALLCFYVRAVFRVLSPFRAYHCFEHAWKQGEEAYLFDIFIRHYIGATELDSVCFVDYFAYFVAFFHRCRHTLGKNGFRRQFLVRALSMT